MKSLFAIAAILTITSLASAKMIKETIYTGKLDQSKINTTLIVSKFYEVKLNKDNTSSFQYNLRPELKNSDLDVGIYKATAYTLLPTISSKLAMALKTDFKQVGEFQIDGEMISFEGDLSIEQTKIGNVKFQFNMYDLPIRRIYNPKVTRGMENTPTGFIIIENREIP